MPLFAANLDSVGSGRRPVGGDGDSGISSDHDPSHRHWSIMPQTVALEVKPPQAAVAAWRPARCFGSGNLKISSDGN